MMSQSHFFNIFVIIALMGHLIFFCERKKHLTQYKKFHSLVFNSKQKDYLVCIRAFFVKILITL